MLVIVYGIFSTIRYVLPYKIVSNFEILYVFFPKNCFFYFLRKRYFSRDGTLHEKKCLDFTFLTKNTDEPRGCLLSVDPKDRISVGYTLTTTEKKNDF